MISPLISVIVPVYRVERYLRNCIESVLHQTYPHWELILVDDGSPDQCPEICDEYARNNSRIRVIHKENGGLSSARNAALDIFEGSYVAFLDSDDFWHQDYLKVLLELCEKTGADLAQCNFLRGMETSFPPQSKIANVYTYCNHSIFTKHVANIIMWGKLYRRHLFDDIRMPIGLINEDDWTTWKLYYRAKHIVVTTQPLYYYTYNVDSIMLKSRKPDLRYFGAYEERITFFSTKGMRDLEDCSRLQFCKALLLSDSNRALTKQEHDMIKMHFDKNWLQLRYSPYVKLQMHLLFSLFYYFPRLTSWTIVKLRKK